MSNYTYKDGAVHNDHHKEITVNISGKTDIVSLIKAFMSDDKVMVEEVPFVEESETFPISELLCTPEAKALHEKLSRAGWVDERWNPIGLSNAEKGTLAEYLSEKLDIRPQWKFFGRLWHMDSETLRTSKARGLEQEKTWKFRSKLDEL